MRIDIGPEGRIVGTKRVSTGGTVAGLATHAGKDVLIVLPDGRPVFRFSARDYVHGWQKNAQKGAKRVVKELRGVQARLPTPQAVLVKARRELSRRALAKRIPDAAQARRLVLRRVNEIRRRKDVRNAERWVKARWTAIESRVRPAAA